MMSGRVISGLVLAGFLTACAGPAHEPEGDGAIRAWLQAHEVAISSRNIQRVTPFYHSDVTIFEREETNDGWADYRDNHLGPELQAMDDLQFSRFNVTPHLLDRERTTACVTAEFRAKGRVQGREIDIAGLETLVLVKDPSGAWKIRHSHASVRDRPAQASPAPQTQP